MPVPGPAALGRGVVINAGDGIPAPWITADGPHVRSDRAGLRLVPDEVVG